MDPSGLRRKLASRARDDRGTSLIELLVVMVCMSLILGGVVGIYVSGLQAQAGLTAGFQAQTAIHLGVNKMRKDINLACSETAQSATSVTLSEPPCDGTVLVTWCTQGSGTQYGLYRISGSTCTGGSLWADYLTGGSIFSYLAQNTTNTTPATGSYALPRLHVDMTVNSNPAQATFAYREVDDFVFRNGLRT
jgi:type II secretory pathway pseudopilin PulG